MSNNLAGLGVRVVIVLGARQQIDDLLTKQGEAPEYAAGYRVTDATAMHTAVQAAGASRMAVEAQLSRVSLLPQSLLPASCTMLMTSTFRAIDVLFFFLPFFSIDMWIRQC